MLSDIKNSLKLYNEYNTELSLFNLNKHIVRCILHHVFMFNVHVFMLEENRNHHRNISEKYRDDPVIISTLLKSKNAFKEKYSGELYNFYKVVFKDKSIPKILYEKIPQLCYDLKDIPDELFTVDACIQSIRHAYNTTNLMYIKEVKPEYITFDFWIECIKVQPTAMYREACNHHVSNPFSAKEFEMIHMVAFENGVIEALKNIIQTEALWIKYVQKIGHLEHVPDLYMTDELLLCYLIRWRRWCDITDDRITKKFVCEAIRRDWELIICLNSRYKNKKVCEIALSQSPRALGFIPKRYKTQQVCNECFKKDNSVFDSIPDEYKSEEMCLSAVNFNPNLLSHVPDCCLSDNIVISALTKDVNVFARLEDRRRTLVTWLYCYELTNKDSRAMMNLRNDIKNIKDHDLKYKVIREIIKRGDTDIIWIIPIYEEELRFEYISKQYELNKMS